MKKIEQEVLDEIERQIEDGEEYHEIKLTDLGRMAPEWEIIFKVNLHGIDRFFLVESQGYYDDGSDQLDFDEIKDEIKEVTRSSKIVEYWKILD